MRVSVVLEALGHVGVTPLTIPASRMEKVFTIIPKIAKLGQRIKINKIFWLRVLSALLIFWGAAGSNAFAQTTQLIEAIPKAWRLQNYVGGPVIVYYTGSPCQSGQISMPISATSDEQNRFYSLIMSAKISGQEVGVYYAYDGASCIVTSFYLKES